MTTPNTPIPQGRTTNGHPDTMRRKYRELTSEEQGWADTIKTKGDEFYQFLNSIETTTGARHIAVARDKIEEAVMWAVKGVTG